MSRSKLLSIAEVVKQIKLKNENPVTIVQKSYETFQSYNYLNAFTYAAALPHLEKKLADLECGNNNGSLLGIPIAVKDNFCVENIPATCGSKMLRDFIPPYTATVVQKLIDAGAIIFGKTNLDEFGMGCGTIDSVFGPTKNVWGLDELHKIKIGEHGTVSSFSDWRIPGGSSGGSAVAVASGICFGALGSDTGGSTRNPASYCGVIGLKPTYGLLSRHGLIPLVNSMDVPAILARTVEDCALILNVTKGFDEKDSTSHPDELSAIKIKSDFSLDGIRIGIPKEFINPDIEQEVLECWKETSQLLKELGAQVSEVSLPHTKYSISCYTVLNACEVASNMARYDGIRYGHRTPNPKINSTEGLYAQNRHEAFNEVVRGRILVGNYFLLKSNYEKYFMQALKVRRLITQDFERTWDNGIDILLTPVTLSAAPKYSTFVQLDSRTQTSVQDYCTQSANMAGVPAVSIPIRLNKEGLPLSLQLIGPMFTEDKLLNVAAVIERLVKFPHFGYLNRNLEETRTR